MDLPRTLAGALAANRIAFGLNYLVRPASAGPSWIGRGAKHDATKVMTRSQAARDVALGAGALLALARRRPEDARIWFAGHALADGADLIVTWAARDRLPRRGVNLALAVAGASTAVAAIGATRIA